MSAHRDERAVEQALSVLGVDRLALGVHASAFPPAPGDVGYGSPGSQAGTRVLDFARRLGFNALQLGPGGQVSDLNPSPYDGTVFARNLCTLALPALCDERSGLLGRDELEGVLEREGPAPSRSDPARARRIVGKLLESAHRRFASLAAEHPDHPLVRSFLGFRRQHDDWLELDCLYEVMADRIGHDDPARFEPGVRALFESSTEGQKRRRSLRATLDGGLERAELAQFLLELQHADFQARARERGIALLGDLQVGWSVRDRFLRADAFAADWLLGAPPSRTNPDGQPWGYPLLSPDQFDDPDSPARRVLTLRLRREFAAHDGLRIDHPHGLVCPFIYRAGTSDPARAVRDGTRAFESPDLDDAELRRWAVARAGDLNPDAPNRWADDWVRQLDEVQVARYARLIDLVLEVAREHGRSVGDIAVEVLSTCPFPLARVLARHGLGRFRVTQKADPDDPLDVYRTDRAGGPDWVMLGNHDTPPIFAVIERWQREGTALPRARYLARRLFPGRDEHEQAARLCASPGALAQAHLADLFLSEARHVLVYFTDLFGEHEPFNRAGVVHPDNWSMRLPAELEGVHAARVRDRSALDLPLALAMALRARGVRPDLAAALGAESL